MNETLTLCATVEKSGRGTRRSWSSAAIYDCSEELEIVDPNFFANKMINEFPKMLESLQSACHTKCCKAKGTNNIWTFSSISGSCGKQLRQIADQIIVLLGCCYFSNAQFGQKVQKLAKLITNQILKLNRERCAERKIVGDATDCPTKVGRGPYGSIWDQISLPKICWNPFFV